MADLLILNYNDSSTTIELVKKVVGFKSVNRVLIVDNKSTDDSFEKISKELGDEIEIIKTDKNGGYGYGNNYGIKYLRDKHDSKYIIIANPDVSFTDQSVMEMECFLEEHKTYAIVAPVMHDKNDNRMDNFGWDIPKKSSYIIEMGLIGSKKMSKPACQFDFSKPTIELDAVAGSLLMINAALFSEAGCYDENVFLYCEETIIGFRLKKIGYRSAVLTGISYIHNHSVTISKAFKSELKRRKIMLKSKLYVLKHYYRANIFEMLFARIIAFFSLIETFIISIVRR